MKENRRVVHYLNQFFGQIGGEEKANISPQKKDGPIGPGMAFDKTLSGEAKIIGTVICGDSYFNENTEQASQQIIEMITSYQPDAVICGPAFNAGRYGVACGTVASLVEEELGIPTVTGMFVENPGVEMFKSKIFIISTKDSAAGMREAIPKISSLLIKRLEEKDNYDAEEDGYFDQGMVRKNYFAEDRGAKRAINMLLTKLRGAPFTTEYPMPEFDRVHPSDPLINKEKKMFALVTSGGIVPKGNPDKIEASSATKYGRYCIENESNLTDQTYETAHGGYDPTYANEDPDRVLPLDAMRELEDEGFIGKLFPYFYSTVGNGTSVANAKKYAEEIAAELINEGVEAVILTST